MSHPAAGLGLDATGGWLVIEPMVALPAVAAGALYLRGWLVLRHRLPARFGAAQAAAFGAGLAALLLALCAPLDLLGHRSLRAHMVQHLLLMLVAPPLLWLGAPVAPLLIGLPRRVRYIVATALATRPLRRAAALVADPRIAWIAYVVAFWAWHAPALYDLALHSDAWHHVEHACFFVTGLAFWRAVITPWPARPAWPRWAMIVYLLLAEAQATLLSAILTFSDRVIYPVYQTTQASPLDDQALAGVIMWVPGSIPFTLALLWLVVRALGPQPPSPARAAAAATTAVTARHGNTATSAGQRS